MRRTEEILSENLMRVHCGGTHETLLHAVTEWKTPLLHIFKLNYQTSNEYNNLIPSSAINNFNRRRTIDFLPSAAPVKWDIFRVTRGMIQDS